MDASRGPLQDAWAREVQRRHMRQVVRRQRQSSASETPNHHGGSSSSSSEWRAFERALPPTQRRFANFVRYGYTPAEVPEAITEDMATFFELSAAAAVSSAPPSIENVRSGGRRVAHAAMRPAVTDDEFQSLKEASACEVPRLVGSDCVICMKPIESRASCKLLTCGHAFDARCLRAWLKRSRTCPCCRQEVLPSSTPMKQHQPAIRRQARSRDGSAMPPTQ